MSASIKLLTPRQNAVEKRGLRGLQPRMDIVRRIAQAEVGRMGGRERLHLFGEPKGNPHAVATF